MSVGGVVPDLTLSAMTMRGRPFGHRCAAVAAAGCSGIGLTADDYRAAVAVGLTDETMLDCLREHGLCVTEVESPWDWAGDRAEDEREQAVLAHMARTFGIDQLSVVLLARHEHDALVERLTRLGPAMTAARPGPAGPGRTGRAGVHALQPAAHARRRVGCHPGLPGGQRVAAGRQLAPAALRRPRAALRGPRRCHHQRPAR